MSETEPKLAPPGAGIPWYQGLFLRFYVNPFVAGKEPLEASRKRFVKKHEKIRAAFLEIPDRHRQKKVLIPPLMGLEDSSRYWSAAMVLEHLIIVGSSMAEAIIRLSNDQDPGITADTAKVKPKGGATAMDTFANFEQWRHDLLPLLDARVGSYGSARTLDHPWFGPFNARKWFWVLGIHADIHLKQLRAIRAGLEPPNK